jgi:hypothetical protein
MVIMHALSTAAQRADFYINAVHPGLNSSVTLLTRCLLCIPADC